MESACPTPPENCEICHSRNVDHGQDAAITQIVLGEIQTATRSISVVSSLSKAAVHLEISRICVYLTGDIERNYCELGLI